MSEDRLLLSSNGSDDTCKYFEAIPFSEACHQQPCLLLRLVPPHLHALSSARADFVASLITVSPAFMEMHKAERPDLIG